MKAFRIDNFIPHSGDKHFITKFGGQPDWMERPQWPVSHAWDNRPLKFIGQIRLNDFHYEPEKLSLAYIFMTQPKDRTDPFYDPDIMIPDEGESAVIIQPGGKIPEYIHVEDFPAGPTVDSKNIWIPQTTEIEETLTTEFKEIDADKFCGIPAFISNSKVESDSKLLLQLHTNWLPFYVNAGGAPTMFVNLLLLIFIHHNPDGGLLCQCTGHLPAVIFSQMDTKIHVFPSAFFSFSHFLLWCFFCKSSEPGIHHLAFCLSHPGFAIQGNIRPVL